MYFYVLNDGRIGSGIGATYRRTTDEFPKWEWIKNIVGERDGFPAKYDIWCADGFELIREA
jgi:hypothetical protein